jgi:hypothetical protein
MKESDWKLIRHFQAKEVIATGASPSDVKVELFLALDKFRDKVGSPVFLIRDGLTTGKHSSPGHKNGTAVDGFLRDTVRADTLFKAALESGFRAIGIYWNGTVLSFHLELDTEYRFWVGRKKKGAASWTYGELIIDPSKP